MSRESRVAYLPSGEMNTALAIKGRARGYSGILWNHSERAQRYFERYHASRNLRGIRLDGIEGTYDIEKALDGARVVFIAPRSEDLEEVIEGAKPYITQDMILVAETKGLVEVRGDFLTPTQIIDLKVLHAKDRTAFLAGPNFAKQIAQGKISGTTVVTSNAQTGEQVKDVIHDDHLFRVDIYQSDPVPVEVISAYKNVVGLIMGFAKTLPEYGENTGALILQKGLAEAAVLCKILGGDPTAIMELVGVGDYGLLMNSTTSRNVQAGILFGRGKIDLDGLLHSDTTYEGVRTVKAIRTLFKKLPKGQKVYLPLAMTVYRILYTHRDPADAVRTLLRGNS